LYLVIQCALVGYQIAWSGENWRNEFGQKITTDRQILQKTWKNKEDNHNWRYDFLTTSKYNKRIYNIKTKRIQKFNKTLNTENNFYQFWNDLEKLNNTLAKTMNAKVDNKTITFATKMFGYAYEIISWQDTIYPMSINIPLDSRLKTIYLNTVPLNKEELKGDIKNNKIDSYFQNLSQKHNIPPLHLDSILRLDYRYNFFKK
jgi:DNA-(apurinic or apyrimidinic site) lyase